MAIATLTVDINAKLAGIQGDLGKVSHLAEQNAKRIEAAFSNVGSAIKGVFAGIAATVTVGFLSNVVQQAVDAQDALVDLSKSTALSVETLAGLGFAVLPSYLADPLVAEGRLVKVLEDRMTEGPSLTAVYPHRRHLAGKVRALIDHLVGWFADHPVR